MNNFQNSSICASRRPFRFTAGYTLVEIMLVLAIISVLIGAAIYKMSGSLDAARETRVGADIASITTALKTYEMQNLFLPTTEQGLEALSKPPTTDPKPRRWHKLWESDTLPTDPWGMPYQYRNPGVKNPNGFDLFSFGPDRKESADDLGNWNK